MEFSELFFFASFRNVRLSKFGIFLEKNGIFELAKLSQKFFWKKFGNLSSEKSSDINQSCTTISKISKKLGKVWVYCKQLAWVETFSASVIRVGQIYSKFLSQKTLFLRQKVQKQGFPNVQKFRKLFYSKLSKNYEKMTFNSNFKNLEKLVPTQKPSRKFG